MTIVFISDKFWIEIFEGDISFTANQTNTNSSLINLERSGMCVFSMGHALGGAPIAAMGTVKNSASNNIAYGEQISQVKFRGAIQSGQPATITYRGFVMMRGGPN